jgi:ketosteroid isomerase-like protein
MAHDDCAPDVLAVAACLREAFRLKDLPVILSLMTDDVVIVPPLGVPVVGLDAVRTAFASNPLPWKYNVEDFTRDVSVEVLGNVAIVSGNRVTVFTPENPVVPSVTMEGRTIAVYRRQVNGWKLARFVSLGAPATSAITQSEAASKR